MEGVEYNLCLLKALSNWALARAQRKMGRSTNDRKGPQQSSIIEVPARKVRQVVASDSTYLDLELIHIGGLEISATVACWAPRGVLPSCPR